jgi:hypothetical protein
MVARLRCAVVTLAGETEAIWREFYLIAQLIA